MKKGDPTVVALDRHTKVARSGSMARTMAALQSKPEEWLTVEDMAIISGLSPKTVYVKGALGLFNLQIVEREYSYDERLEPTAKYRIRDEVRQRIGRISVVHDQSDVRR